MEINAGMILFLLLICVLAVLAFGGSYFIRRYTSTKQSNFRLACWWGRIASGIIMVLTWILLISLSGSIIYTIIMSVKYMAQYERNIKDICSMLFDNIDYRLFILLAVMAFVYYLGKKNLIKYNEMFLSEYREAWRDQQNNPVNNSNPADGGFFCTYCGVRCIKDSKFCTSCGRKVEGR
jgi:Na+/proline symporter